MNDRIQAFAQCDRGGEWHALMTIQLGELIESGVVDFTDGTWAVSWYSKAQGARIWQKFTDRYYLREISILPVGQWKREVLRKLNEVMPKYKQLYRALKNADLMADQNDYGKSRDVFSDFPATQLAPGTEDYASNASDREYEHVHLGSTMDKAEQLAKRYNDVDVLILDDLELMFCQIISPTVPGWGV